MNDLKPLICPACGGGIDRHTMSCNYCGIQFKREHEDEPIRIVSMTPGTVKLNSSVLLDREMLYHLGAQETSNIVMKEVTKKLVDCIAPFVEYRCEYDPIHMRHRVDARLTVVKPVHYEDGGEFLQGEFGRFTDGR